MGLLADNNKWNQYIIHGILMPIVAAFGICGNVAGILYFRKRRLQQLTFYLLLISLAIFDLLFIITATLIFSAREIFPNSYNNVECTMCIYLDRWALPMAQLSLFGSTYFTVAICFERYLAICCPFQYRAKTTKPILYIIAITCFVVSFNIPHFFEWKIEHSKEKIQLKITDLRNNRLYYYIYGVALKFTFQYIIPCSILIILNVKIMKSLLTRSSNIIVTGNAAINNQNIEVVLQVNLNSEAAQRKKRRKIQSDLAKLNLIIVIIFMTCLPLGCINDIYEVYYGIQKVITLIGMHSL